MNEEEDPDADPEAEEGADPEQDPEEVDDPGDVEEPEEPEVDEDGAAVIPVGGALADKSEISVNPGEG